MSPTTLLVLCPDSCQSTHHYTIIACYHYSCVYFAIYEQTFAFALLRLLRIFSVLPAIGLMQSLFFCQLACFSCFASIPAGRGLSMTIQVDVVSIQYAKGRLKCQRTRNINSSAQIRCPIAIDPDPSNVEECITLMCMLQPTILTSAIAHVQFKVFGSLCVQVLAGRCPISDLFPCASSSKQ